MMIWWLVLARKGSKHVGLAYRDYNIKYLNNNKSAFVG
jgi:hypothetical protein